ncbi:Swi3-domain-containing protein [Periconia macrospinosa]|uniref:Chromosome segregation in meiosis protein n=1 Tax=Periconia macrospinosa TaxID=97972 RepID=A0A2V1E6P1_9PLEO|nr:Swi3-domain-containing protein [Periconia macrospinosa]
MAAMDPSNDDIPADDELDAILNGTLNGEDIFDTSNIDAQLQAQPSQPPVSKKVPGDDVLGLEEEIKVTKKKLPIPKLNNELLFSDRGIPKLRKISKDRLKLKGKGHEYGDIARLLNMYQLWLDDLFPRAKFADGLLMIEKLGHTKNMQMMRKAWIDEGKPRDKSDPEDEVEDAVMAERPPQEQDRSELGDVADTNRLLEGQAEGVEQAQRIQDTAGQANMQPEEDELDALLAEGADFMNSQKADPTPKTVAAEDDPFADDMEAMAGMEDMW